MCRRRWCSGGGGVYASVEREGYYIYLFSIGIVETVLPNPCFLNKLLFIFLLLLRPRRRRLLLLEILKSTQSIGKSVRTQFLFYYLTSSSSSSTLHIIHIIHIISIAMRWFTLKRRPGQTTTTTTTEPKLKIRKEGS